MSETSYSVLFSSSHTIFHIKILLESKSWVNIEILGVIVSFSWTFNLKTGKQVFNGKNAIHGKGF